MAYLSITPETRTDPKDVTLIVDTEFIIEEVEYIYRKEGIMPTTINLVDDYTEEDIEIDVAEYLDLSDLVMIENKWREEVEQCTE